MTADRNIQDAIRRLREELHEHVVGYDDVIDDLLRAAIGDAHLLLEGVPGVAKTTLAESFALASGLEFQRLQFTPDLLPSDVTGHYFYNEKTQDFEFRPGPIFTNILLVDEINRAPPKTQAALLEAMEEGQVTVEGETFPLQEPFVVLATLNPREVEGVYRLPEALLDRFLARSRMGYLDEQEEFRMLHALLDREQPVDEVLRSSFYDLARRRLTEVHVDEELLRFIHRIGLATREDPRLALGASPRSLEHLILATRTQALIEGRDYATPDDVKHVVDGVLSHRLDLDIDAEVEGANLEAVIQDIVQAVPVPK